MRGLTNALAMLFRLGWLVNIVLGILFWTGTLLQLVPLHMLVGLVVAVLLLILSILAAVRGAILLAVAGVIVAIAMPIVGVSQDGWLTGSDHWVIQVVHVLIAVLAIAIAESARGRIAGRRAAPTRTG